MAPTTRARRSTAAVAAHGQTESASAAAAPTLKTSRKRNAAVDGAAPVAAPPSPPKKRARTVVVPATPMPAPAIQSASIPTTEDTPTEALVRPQLSFSYQAAKDHLVSVDPRFANVFAVLKCKPYEEELEVNPFRALCTSILGQQISWLAARSITHKFIRLVAFPDLPEKAHPTEKTSVFPSPRQVLECPMATLRSAGLSQRKAEYVQDLAGRFVDGRLSPQKLIDMSDDDVMKALVEVRGIGRWTVEMFMMFTLRRPDVLPVGDLGVQKGLVKWLTEVNPGIQGKKLPDANEKDAGPSPQGQAAPATPDLGRQATPPPAAANGYSSSSTAPETPLPLSTPGPPSTPLGNPHAADLPLMTPRTEAIAQLPPFPPSDTLPTRQALQARLKKKAKGNVYLTPPEMELLTETWKPYRSIGVYFLWAIADGDSASI